MLLINPQPLHSLSRMTRTSVFGWKKRLILAVPFIAALMCTRAHLSFQSQCAGVKLKHNITDPILADRTVEHKNKIKVLFMSNPRSSPSTLLPQREVSAVTKPKLTLLRPSFRRAGRAGLSGLMSGTWPDGKREQSDVVITKKGLP